MSTGARLKLKLNKKPKLALSSSKKEMRTKNAGKSMDKEKPYSRGDDGSRGNTRRSVRTKEGINGGFGGREKSRPFDSNGRKRRVYTREETGQNDGGFGGREKPRPFDSNGRKRRVYGREETGQNGRSQNYAATFKKKVKEEVVEAKQAVRSRWPSGNSSNADSEAKISFSKKKVKEETFSLPNAKQRAKSKEGGKKESVRTDGSNAGLLKKRREQKSEFSKDKSQNVVPPSSSPKKKARVKAAPDDDVTNDKPKKKKRVIRIDPHDISNKRLDDGLVTSGSAKEKKKESEDNHEMSKNAQFRAIQPSPSILSFVENNLLGRRRSIEIRRAGYNIELSAPLDNVPFSTSSERERIEDNIFRNKLEFFAAAKVSSSFPPPNLPEIAFAGRSNVGKSSLLNALTRQWGVVRTSDKPGLTQTINFFQLGTKLCLVDLPGYGFAYAKEEVKEAWEDLVKEYVSTRVGLKRVCLLIDTKWGMKPRDHELVELMERSKTKYQIVLTKTDTIFPIDVARRTMQIEESLKENKSIVQPTMMVSSKSGAGIRSLRTILTKIAQIARV